MITNQDVIAERNASRGCKFRGRASGRQISCRKSLAIILDARRSEAGNTDPIEQALPVRQFFARHPIPRARFVRGQQAAFYCCDNLRLAPADPPRRLGRREARDVGSRNEERTAIGADPEQTRVRKKDKIQPAMETRSDHSGSSR